MFKDGKCLERKISLICVIHCPKLVMNPPVKEVDRGDDLHLTSASTVLSSLWPTGAARHLKQAQRLFIFMCSPGTREILSEVGLRPTLENSPAQKGDPQVRDAAPRAAKIIRNKFCLGFQPGPVPFTSILQFPFRLFRSLIRY